MKSAHFFQLQEVDVSKQIKIYSLGTKHKKERMSKRGPQMDTPM